MKSIAFHRRWLLAVTLSTTSLLVAQSVRAEAPSSLRERQDRIIKIAAEVAPAVVAIVPDAETAEKNGTTPGMGSGSGVIVSEDGLILTAAHVLQAVGEDFKVILSNGDSVRAKSLGRAYGRDAAMGRIIEPGKYPFVNRAKPEDLQEGAWALAMGHPGGYEVDRSAPLRLGRVIHSDIEGFIVTDCTLSGGDSGGPLFNLDGKLIGIHSSIGMRYAENRHVPMEAFDKNWDRLLQGDEWGRLGMRDREPRGNRQRTPRAQPADAPAPDQPRLGIVISVDDGEGALVGEVAKDSPADQAGVKPGDVITRVDGKSVTDADALVSLITQRKPGDEITLTVTRGKETLELKTKIVAAKDIKTE